jgi:hypothetical protein
MNLCSAALRSALLALFSRREQKQHLHLVLQRSVALGMALLLLPLAQIDALAQQQYPQKPSPYPSQQYGQQNPYAQPNPNYAPQQPGYPSQAAPYYSQQQPAYPQQPSYPNQPYGQQSYPQQQYPQPAPAQPGNQDYADQGAYPDQPGPGQSPDLSQQPDQGFASQQLEQLVAPIALYPDALVAQILAASTYPAQVVAADHWLQSMGRVSPDQVAGAANAQSTWDPSVKALTAFPQVLAMLDRDLQWTTDLGNAYYNQPQDVLSTIQVLRQRAQTAGTLRSTPQEEVTSDQGYIQLAPTNPEVVYVPNYNPWYAYGAPINPYPGFYLVDAFGHAIAGIGEGIVFGAGIALGAFFHATFGWLGWGLNWHGGGIFYHHEAYYSHSTSVAHWGGFRGGYGGGYRGGYGGGRSLPNRPMPLGRENAGNYRAEQGYGRASNGFENQRNQESQRNQEGQRSTRDYPGSTYRGPSSSGPAYRGNENYGSDRGQAFAGNRTENYAYGRPQYTAPMRQQFAAPQQQYGRPQAYANPGFNSGGYRGQQSFANERSYAAPASRAFHESAPRYESSGGSHFSGGGHGESFHAPKAPSYHAPKAPKMSGGGHSSGGGLFHHSGGGGGKHH